MTTAYLGPDNMGRARDVIRDDGLVLLGRIVLSHGGWRFYPHYQRSPSRRGWPTPAMALKSYDINLDHSKEGRALA